MQPYHSPYCGSFLFLPSKPKGSLSNELLSRCISSFVYTNTPFPIHVPEQS